MRATRLATILAAAGHLCWAAEQLRAAGLVAFAAEIEELLQILDAEIAVADEVSPEPPPN